MALAENIQAKRKAQGLSQEKLAELMDVSRQAVTKWETGQSAPSSENLLRLAEVLDTSAAALLASKQEKPDEAEAAAAAPTCPAPRRLCFERRSIRAAALIAAGFIILNLIGRLVGGSDAGAAILGELSVLGWLFGASPYQLPYLLGWLLARGLFWWCMGLCCALALAGKRKFAWCGFAGFALGIQLGEAFGPNPAGAALGQGHCGWLIWGVCMLAGLVVGAVLEKKKMKLSAMKLWLKTLLVCLCAALLLTTLFIGWGRSRTVDFDAGACGGGYATHIFDKYQDTLVNTFLAGSDQAADISNISAVRGTQQASWEGQTIYLEFTLQYDHAEAGTVTQQIRFVGHRVWFDTFRWSGAILVG